MRRLSRIPTILASMRTRSAAVFRAVRRVTVLAAVALAATATAIAVSAGGEQPTLAPGQPPSEAWQGLVGDPRPEVAIGQLSLVVLNLPSLADRVAAAGGLVGDRQERKWAKEA